MIMFPMNDLACKGLKLNLNVKITERQTYAAVESKTIFSRYWLHVIRDFANVAEQIAAATVPSYSVSHMQ